MAENLVEERRAGLSTFHLLDAAAVVVGYSLASVLVRAYWPEGEPPSLLETSVIGMVFLWLGLAMSGPVVLLVRRAPASGPGEGVRREPRTWAELAWLIIGFYWVGLTMLLVPGRMNGARFLDSALLGVFPVLASLVLRVVGHKTSGSRDGPGRGRTAWTHRTGVVLLVTWPFAWVGLILLGKTLL